MPAQAKTKVEPQSEADAKMVDLPSEGESIDVQLDDSKEKVINKDESTDVVLEEKPKKKETASEGEMEDYGKKVQSRIDKLTKKVREAERREQAATEYARNVYHENKSLQHKAQSLDDGYVNQYENRVTAELDTVKKQLKQAVESGDVDKQVEANQHLARLSVEAERVRTTQEKKERLRVE